MDSDKTLLLTEEESKKKEKILVAMAKSTKELLANRNYKEAIYKSLNIMGLATEMDNIYMFKTGKVNDYEKVDIKLKWDSPFYNTQIDLKELEDIHISKIEDFIKTLLEDKGIYTLVSDIENDLIRGVLTKGKIISVAVIPVFVRGNFWGIIGFNESKCQRNWSEVEVAILNAFTSSIESALERSLIEEELEIARKVAETANSMKSQFLANMSHEIRTPMNGILGFLDLLNRSELSSEQRDFVKEAKSASEVLLYLINDILDFSKIEAGKMNMEKILFNFRLAVEDSVAIFLPRAAEKHIQINTMIKSNVPEEVEGDPSRLRQIINNLVSNAVKFTRKGEISINVECIEIVEKIATIKIQVKDTGIGISHENIKELFMPFIQADTSTTRKYGGSGLGLAISKELIKMMDGVIGVESEINKGSNFYFTAKFKVSDKIETSKPKYAKVRNNNILIVDDNESNRKILRAYLEEEGCRVMEVASADKAITTILLNLKTGNAIDVAMVDFEMADMNGMQLVSILKAIPYAKDIKCILLTSLGQKGEAEKAKENGFSAYLSKPVRRNEVLDCLSLVLSISSDEAASNFVTRYTIKENPCILKPRLLLVDDNEMNRKIVTMMLKNSDLSCDIAVNGEEAFNAVKEKCYDIVFMDCQMPVMDGYESTKKIREYEMDKKHTCIVAMTANAMEGDKEKCLQVGMDDYMSKPINFNIMLEIIKKYTDISHIEASKFIEESIDVFIKSTGFTRSDAKQIFNEFSNTLPQMIQTMQNSLNRGDFEFLAKLAHQLKGSSGNLRVESVRTLATELEFAALEKNEKDCSKIICEIKNIFR